MQQKAYNKASAVVFSLAGLLHLLRSVMGWELVLGGVAIPFWVSWILVLLVGYLAYSAYKLR